MAKASSKRAATGTGNRSTREEDSLVARMQADDESVLSVLFGTLEPATKSRLRQRLRMSETDVEDALALARYRLWSARHEFDPKKSSLRTWFWTIAYRCAIDMKRQEAPPDVCVHVSTELIRIIQKIQQEPARRCSPAEEAAQEIVASLNETDRAIIRHYAGAYEESSWSPAVAKELSMTPQAIRVRCLRVREKIKREMARQGFRFARHVLVVEDSDDSRRFMETVLRKAGASVGLAEDGQAAFDTAMEMAAGGDPFDVILMDMRMPNVDGYQSTRMLRDADYSGTIIAVTVAGNTDNYSNWVERGRCIEAGCNDYVCKPVTPQQLVNMVTRSQRT